MENNEVDFYVGRLNLITNYDDKFKYLYNSLESKKAIIRKHGYEYGFFDIHSKTIGEYNYLMGFLVKYKPKADEEKVDKEHGKLTTAENRDKVKDKSKFVLQVQTGLISYAPVPNVIDEQNFRNSFSDLIEKANDQFFVDAKIRIISKEVDVIYAIENFDQINEVDVDLHPSNPTNRDIWKDIDNELHDLKAESYNVKYKSKNGLDINNTNKSFAEINMAADGYGKAKIKGKKDGEKKTASTDEIPEKQKSVVNKASEIEQKILKKFKEIIDRMDN